ncbi:hypothetical protein GPECTOR_191g304 [Gonium pectorale]|uniref:Uncharacterized protein n=1 Tax=Gonium pectorale TaxID=33097 RepID=A0A150FX34_GONPE|nr:hypothetical protein GPECTOR_191g304 [Gonium pectorale]|eukprot:KXZ42172.1 hypothetical protein GPECTOR_191g304 [Gonium pectorale]
MPCDARRTVLDTTAASTGSAYAQPQPQSLPVSLTQFAAGAVPNSYRAITTDPAFRPATAGCSQYAPGPPQLRSRHLTLNPLHGLAAWAEARLSGLDRAAAAALDGRPLAQGAAAAVTAALTYWGLHPLSLLTRGLPAAAADWLEVQLGEWALPLAAAAALAAGVVAALWQLRTWGAAQLALIRLDDVQPRQAAPSPGEASPAPADSTAEAEAEAAPAGPFAGLIPEPLRGLFEADWKPTDRTWLYAILAARLGTLLTAASCLLHGATTTAAAYAAACFGASLLPVALPHLRHLIGSAPAVPGGATGLAAPLLAADAALVSELGTARLSTQAPAAAALAGVRGGGGAVSALAGAESWGPVAVVAVADEWVQLDANAGLAAGEVEVEVELLALRKAS